MTPSTNTNIREKIEKLKSKFIGFNDRGIVYYSDGLAVTGYKTPTATCRNCGAHVEGEEAKEWQFGHVGCPKPNGGYVRNNITADELSESFDQILTLISEEIEKMKEAHDYWKPTYDLKYRCLCGARIRTKDGRCDYCKTAYNQALDDVVSRFNKLESEGKV